MIVPPRCTKVMFGLLVLGLLMFSSNSEVQGAGPNFSEKSVLNRYMDRYCGNPSMRATPALAISSCVRTQVMSGLKRVLAAVNETVQLIGVSLRSLGRSLRAVLS
jgi:hypothetical protein